MEADHEGPHRYRGQPDEEFMHHERPQRPAPSVVRAIW